ncbi:MAG: helix-turn-helix domain-containing protein [Holosporales bacterium]
MTITGKTAAQLHAQWLKNPDYVREFNALEEEFSLASALMEARDRSGLSQKELAQRMRTSQSAIARLEGGSQNTSLKTLQRYAKATGNKLRLCFEPVVVAEQPQ